MTRDLWHHRHGVSGGTCRVAVWGWRRGICRWNGHGMRVVMVISQVVTTDEGKRAKRRGQADSERE